MSTHNGMYTCPLMYGEERQVQASSLVSGLRALPCIPATGCERPITSIPNGTFITFDRWFEFNDNSGSIMWEFHMADDLACRFYLAPENLPALWRARRLIHGRPRRRW